MKAGVNIELPEPDCYLHLVELVRKGVLKESQLDELVAPMLLVEVPAGPVRRSRTWIPTRPRAIVGCDANRELALQAARETITLLKNESNLRRSTRRSSRPSRSSGRTPTASLLGGYSGVPKHDVTVLEGIQAKVGKRVKVLYSEGCKITIGGSWQQDEVVASDPEEDRKQIAEAVKVAKKADVDRAGDRRQRADLARSLGVEAHGRPRAAWNSSAARKNWSRRWSLPASR